MRYFCITGGIGSGKTYICKKLEELGISIYNCDIEAKRLINTSEIIKEKLVSLIGSEIYNSEGNINKDLLRNYILESDINRDAVNKIVHPVVIEDFKESGKYCMESAIIFDAHLESTVDIIIGIVASMDIRIKRVMCRDCISEEQAKLWINNQLPQDYIQDHSDYIINNDGNEDILDIKVKRLASIILKANSI